MKSAEPLAHGLLLEGSELTLRRGGRNLIGGVNVSLSEGEILTLVGPNGSGKSTLLRTLIGLEQPDGGSLRRLPGLRVGYMPQHFHVDRNLPLTVGRFLALAGNRRQLAETAAETGVDRLLDSPVQELSGGEMRRVLLARALLRRPQLLALDEPAAGLDQVSQSALYHMIQQVRDRYRCGVIIISHDLHLVMAATDEVLCLSEGKVCCRGAPASVREQPEYQALFGHDIGPATAVFSHAHSNLHATTSLKGDHRVRHR